MGALLGCLAIAGMILFVADYYCKNFFDPALDCLKRIADNINNENDDEENATGQDSE